MLGNLLEPGVLAIVGVLLTITVFSIYFSRVYLPAKIKEAYLRSITVLAAAVETKDSGTVGHAQRVARMAVEVARRLGMSPEELDRIEYAALLRDIGKAIVPQSVLTKSGQLDPEEWETLQSHSRLGEQMAAAVPFLAHTAPYIRHHHEYWDGSGYPDGLRGDEIPLGSRILAVASDYDALVSDRPYYPRPMNPDEALAEILGGSGTRYDPAVTEAFAAVVAEGVWTREKDKAA